MQATRNRSTRAARTAAWGALALASMGGCRGREQSDAVAPPVVRTAEAVASDSTGDISLSGSLEAQTSVAANFKGPGTVQRVLVEEGRPVSQGQVLAVLDDASARDQLEAAQAKARQAEDAWTRLKPMHENGTIPEIKWVEVETGRDQARSMASMARRNLDDAVLRAPLAGIVARRAIEPGEQVPAGQAAFTIVQTGTMLATLPVAEKDVARLRVGLPASVRVDAAAKELPGRISEIGVQADPLTRTYKVKVAIPNPGGVLRVGMVSEVRLHVASKVPSTSVPMAALLMDATGRRFVWVESKGTVHRRPVRVAGFLRESVAVDSGISSGERVVVSGTPMLSDGSTVRVGN